MCTAIFFFKHMQMNTETFIHQRFPSFCPGAFQPLDSCSEVMEAWEDRCLSICTLGWRSFRLYVFSRAPYDVCVPRAIRRVCLLQRPVRVFCIYGRGGYFRLIVFNEGPTCRIHNNTINPQRQQQHGCNLYGNAATAVAPSHTVGISDSGQHECAVASQCCSQLQKKKKEMRTHLCIQQGGMFQLAHAYRPWTAFVRRGVKVACTALCQVRFVLFIPLIEKKKTDSWVRNQETNMKNILEQHKKEKEQKNTLITHYSPW